MQICSSVSDSMCSSRSVCPFIISSGDLMNLIDNTRKQIKIGGRWAQNFQKIKKPVLANLNRSLCPGSFRRIFSLQQCLSARDIFSYVMLVLFCMTGTHQKAFQKMSQYLCEITLLSIQLMLTLRALVLALIMVNTFLGLTFKYRCSPCGSPTAWPGHQGP